MHHLNLLEGHTRACVFTVGSLKQTVDGDTRKPAFTRKHPQPQAGLIRSGLVCSSWNHARTHTNSKKKQWEKQRAYSMGANVVRLFV
jgi:hypothetical protein